MKTIKTFLVDDETGPLSALKSLIEKGSPELEIVGTAKTVDEAYRQLQLLRPQLVFLDIQLYEQTAFDLLDMPFDFEFEVIFVTAYEEYAIKAFEKNALSYLLKPVSEEDLQRVKKRAIRMLQSGIRSRSEAVKHLFSDRIAIPQRNSVEYIYPNEIIYIKADGSYCELYLTSGRKKVISRPLKFISDRILENYFFRVHRSYVVNINHISKWDKTSGGALIVSNQASIPLSRSGRKALAAIMEEL